MTNIASAKMHMLQIMNMYDRNLFTAVSGEI